MVNCVGHEVLMIDKRGNIGLVISLAGFAISVNTFPPLLEWFATQLAIPISYFGLVYFFQFGSFTLCSMVIGKLHTKFRLPLISISVFALFFSSLCVFLIGSITNFIHLILLMILIGGTGGLVESIGTTLLTGDDGSSRMLHASQFFYAIGAVIAPSMVGFLLATGIRIPHISQHVGSFTFVIAISVFFLTRSAKKAYIPHVEDSGLERTKSSIPVAFMMLFITMTSYVIVESTLANWLAAFALQVYMLSEANASLLLSLFWGGLCLSRLLYVFVTTKAPQKTLGLHMGILIISAFGFIVATTYRSFILLYGSVIFIGVGCGPIWPLLIEFCSATFKAEYLVMYLVGAGSIGALSGPLLTPFLFDRFGIGRVPVILTTYAAAMILAAVATYVTLRASARTPLDNRPLNRDSL